MSKLISFQQAAYEKNRFTGEGGRLISDILEMSESLNLKGYIVTVDVEKAFDSLSHSSLLVCLKKYLYGNYLIKWVQMLLECQESRQSSKRCSTRRSSFCIPIYFMS